jgi:DNA-directed RNA polymerase specialized sigma24 family protein
VVDSLGMRLVTEAKAGDVAAFEALLRPVILPGFRLAYAILHDRTEAEDAVQVGLLQRLAQAPSAESRNRELDALVPRNRH